MKVALKCTGVELGKGRLVKKFGLKCGLTPVLLLELQSAKLQSFAAEIYLL